MIVLGTSLQVAPFNSLIEMVPPNCPRVLLNMEKVKSDPMMALFCRMTGQPAPPGFQFDNPSNTRDVFEGGDVQTSVRRLIDLVGWSEKLEALMAVEPNPTF